MQQVLPVNYRDHRTACSRWQTERLSKLQSSKDLQRKISNPFISVIDIMILVEDFRLQESRTCWLTAANIFLQGRSIPWKQIIRWLQVGLKAPASRCAVKPTFGCVCLQRPAVSHVHINTNRKSSRASFLRRRPPSLLGDELSSPCSGCKCSWLPRCRRHIPAATS